MNVPYSFAVTLSSKNMFHVLRSNNVWSLYGIIDIVKNERFQNEVCNKKNTISKLEMVKCSRY